jgi:hypothetical protein
MGGVKRIKFFVAGNQRSIRVGVCAATKNWVELSPRRWAMALHFQPAFLVLG